MSMPDHLQHALPLIARGLKPETAEATIALIHAALANEFLRGMGESASFIEEVGEKVAIQQTSTVAKILAAQLRELEALNRKSATEAISNRS
jgi:hypothetical protein